MAIEPIGTMTAMQVQSTVKVQPVENNTRDMDVAYESSTTPRLDETTSAVAKATEGNADNKKNDQKEPDQEALKKAIENINKNMVNTSAVYGIHEGTNRVTIKIVDKKTHETIKELPPEKTLDMISRVWEMAGLLVDEKR